jgi:Flp pilus assembly protein protease CpaA
METALAIGVLVPSTITFFTDLIWKKVYNLVTIPAIVAGILYHSIWGQGILFTLIGLALMLVLGCIGLAVNGWGGGDAKMLIFIGTWMGWYGACLVMFIGSLIALVAFAFKLRGEFIKKSGDQLRRIWLSVFYRAKGAWKDFQGIPDGPEDPLPPAVPLGSCLAVGAWLVIAIQAI